VSGSRFFVRAYFQQLNSKLNATASVVIYGAGSKGVELARVLQQQGDYAPVAFLDDDKKLQKRIIDGLYVYPPRHLGRLLHDTDATQVFVAVNSTEALDRRRIIEFLEPYRVRVRLIPDVVELISGRQSIANIRDVELEDLLGRVEVDPLPHLLQGSVRGRCVMVTGAGGSIGSELCRQIIRQRPRLLVTLDVSEFGLFQIQRELKRVCADEGLQAPVVAVLGSVTNRPLVARTVETYHVETLFHAAAYKHVELVEHNVIQGIQNNTFGTLYTAQAAIEGGVKHFILISTDKAVRTTSIMGASKRLAEMVLQALQEQCADTRFSVVRFGNVLGSSGSVVPLFLEQIQHGGPVTVTHSDVTRYFMTISEAAGLVLQAASMSRGGDLFLLDMGEPVKILELARRMIHLKGYTIKDEHHPDGDIAIEITGLKRGEKLHEELLVGEAVAGTEHRKILRAEESFVSWPELRGALATLEEACADYDYDAIKAFIEGLVEGADLAAQLGGLYRSAEIIALKPATEDQKSPR
jgi:FlaA1/EpsC-like NDP-sugar epimerase